MGKRNILMLIGAVILAAFVALLVAGQINKAKRAVQDDTTEVAVAKIDLKWGTVLTKEMIDTAKFLKKSLPSQCITDSNVLPGRVVINPILANVPITESSLAPVTLKTGGVSAVIAPEKRAIGVKVDKIIGVAGFVHPNNRVDVLVTIKRHEGQNYNPITKIILENILVLAVGPDVEKKGKEEKQTPVDVVTLEVTPEEAEKLSLATQEGKISMVLRKYGEAQEVLTSGQTLSTMLNSYSSKTVQASLKEPARDEPKIISLKKHFKKSTSVTPSKDVKKDEKKEEKTKKIYIVEVIKGTKVTEAKFEEPTL